MKAPARYGEKSSSAATMYLASSVHSPWWALPSDSSAEYGVPASSGSGSTKSVSPTSVALAGLVTFRTTYPASQYDASMWNCVPTFLTTMSWRKISLGSLCAACAIFGKSACRSYSATSFGAFGSEMSKMSTSVFSSLSTITAYARSPASHTKALWISLAALLPSPATTSVPWSLVSPIPTDNGVGCSGFVTS